MPAKSRRNRRNIPQSRKVTASPSTSSTATADIGPATQPEKSPVSYRATNKATAPAPTYPYILSEIKWISIVTAIVVVLLVIAYIFFH